MKRRRMQKVRKYSVKNESTTKVMANGRSACGVTVIVTGKHAQLDEFKSWTKLLAFHLAQIILE